jgi:hypothetical protein
VRKTCRASGGIGSKINAWTAMARGSKPGERRGGRDANTPNRRTILTDRILVVAVAHPDAAALKLRQLLIGDSELPVDTRFAVARGPQAKRGKGAAAKAGHATGRDIDQTLDALCILVRDQSLPEQDRRKAAYAIAVLLLPKVPGRSNWPDAEPDEFGLAIHADIAREYRDGYVALKSGSLAPAKRKQLATRRKKIRAHFTCPARRSITWRILDRMRGGFPNSTPSAITVVN